MLACPAQEIESCLRGNDTLQGVSVNLVVTEPLLGPPQTGRESAQQIENILTELSSLYIESFRSISKLLHKNSKVCVTFPVFQLGHKKIFIPIMKELQEMGYQVIDPIPDSVPKKLNTKTPQSGILYERPKQRVAREILVFNYSP